MLIKRKVVFGGCIYNLDSPIGVSCMLVGCRLYHTTTITWLF